MQAKLEAIRFTAIYAEAARDKAKNNGTRRSSSAHVAAISLLCSLQSVR